jgi:hypothetical protein
LAIYKLNSNTIRFSWDLEDRTNGPPADGFLVLFGLNGNGPGEAQFDHTVGGSSGYVDLGPNTSPFPWDPTKYTFVPGSTYTFSIDPYWSYWPTGNYYWGWTDPFIYTMT